MVLDGEIKIKIKIMLFKKKIKTSHIQFFNYSRFHFLIQIQPKYEKHYN